MRLHLHLGFKVSVIIVLVLTRTGTHRYRHREVLNVALWCSVVVKTRTPVLGFHEDGRTDFQSSYFESL
jgi:hypothetical protein